MCEFYEPQVAKLDFQLRESASIINDDQLFFLKRGRKFFIWFFIKQVNACYEVFPVPKKNISEIIFAFHTLIEVPSEEIVVLFVKFCEFRL